MNKPSLEDVFELMGGPARFGEAMYPGTPWF